MKGQGEGRLARRRRGPMPSRRPATALGPRQQGRDPLWAWDRRPPRPACPGTAVACRCPCRPAGGRRWQTGRRCRRRATSGRRAQGTRVGCPPVPGVTRSPSRACAGPDGEAHRVRAASAVPPTSGRARPARRRGWGRPRGSTRPTRRGRPGRARELGDRQRGHADAGAAQAEHAGQAHDVPEDRVGQVEGVDLLPHHADDELEDVGAERGQGVQVEGAALSESSPRGAAGRRARGRSRPCPPTSVGMARLDASRRRGRPHPGSAGRRAKSASTPMVDPATGAAEQQPSRQRCRRSGGCRSAAAGDVEDRDVDVVLTVGARRAGLVLDRDAHAHRALHRLDTAYTVIAGDALGEQRDPLLLTARCSPGGPRPRRRRR